MMSSNRVSFVILAVVLAGAGAGLGAASAAAEQAFLYYSVDPLVVFKGDAEDTMTLEVATTGESVVRVYLASPVEKTLYDDGTHGDRVAGDNIYTCSGIDPKTEWSQLYFGGSFTTSGRLRTHIERGDGSEEVYWLGIGYVTTERHFPVRHHGNGLSSTASAFFIVDPGGQLLDTADWPLGYIHCGRSQFGVFEKLYSVYPDDFDFVIVMPAHPIYDPERSYGENTPYFVRAKNAIRNIGINLFDNTAQFYSDGRLMGMIYHSWGYGSILDHELGHAWAADLGETYELTRCDDCFGNHWNPLSDIGGQMAAYVFHSDVTYGAGHLRDNGDGTWRITRDEDDYNLYSPLELYVMGLLSPTQVPPIHVLVNPDLDDAERVTAEQVITYTIDDLMAAEGGERNPPWRQAQKEFNIAFVVVKNKEFTPAEYAFYSLIPIYFSSEDQGDWSLTTFFTATGGRGRLNPYLPVEPRRVGGRRR